MYHPTKFSYKRIHSSVDMVETVTFNYMSSYCRLGLEDSKPIFSHKARPVMKYYHTMFGNKK